MISLRQPIRTLFFAIVVIMAAVAIRHYFESQGPPLPEDEITAPAVRTARQSPPTIVEPNENWLDSVPDTEVGDARSPLTDQQIPELPPSRRRNQSVRVTR